MYKVKVTITEKTGNKIQRTFDDWKKANKEIKFALDWFVKSNNAKLEVELFEITEK